MVSNLLLSGIRGYEGRAVQEARALKTSKPSGMNLLTALKAMRSRAMPQTLSCGAHLSDTGIRCCQEESYLGWAHLEVGTLERFARLRSSSRTLVLSRHRQTVMCQE